MASFSNGVLLGLLLLSLMGVIRSKENLPTLKDLSPNQYKEVCYLGTWAYNRPEDGKFVIENFDPFLCTHAIYAFARLRYDQITPLQPYLDLKENEGLGGYDRFNNLKKKNPDLKTLIAIIGENREYSDMTVNPTSRSNFVKSVVDFCLKYSFDGLDMNWLHPGNRGRAPHDKQNFVSLLRELKEAFAPYGLLLSAAVSADKVTIDTAYDIPGVSRFVDFINVMTHDLRGFWEERTTSHNSPLYAGPGVPELSVDYAVKYWIMNGAPRSKIILGMATYSRPFTLTNETNNGLGAPVVVAEPFFTRLPKYIGYNEICRDKGWTEVFEESIQAPYAFRGNQWVGYDNVKSIGIKVDYLIQNGLGGGMIYNLETDDFQGSCGGGRFPLLTTITSKLEGKRITPYPKQPTVIPTTTQPMQNFSCNIEGYTIFVHYTPTGCKSAIFRNPLGNSGGFMYESTFNCHLLSDCDGPATFY